MKLLLICLIGALWHGAMKWDEWRREQNKLGKSGSLRKYIMAARSQLAVSLLSTIAAYMVADELGWMNAGVALACGYMGNSVAENIANRFFPKELS